MSDYNLARTAGQCSACGRAFAEGEEFYTVVLEAPEGFQRRDIAADCWQGPPEGSFCHFRTRWTPKPQKRRAFVDDDVLVNFFQRLESAADPLKLGFRFVLALMLMRKRLLKYEGTERNDSGEVWLLRLTKDKSLHRVVNPDIDESRIEELTGELNVILAGDMEQAAEGAIGEAAGAAVDGAGNSAVFDADACNAGDAGESSEENVAGRPALHAAGKGGGA